MKLVRNSEDISKLENNRLIGEPELINTRIQFAGTNNILVCEGDIKLTNANISFNGSNSIVYLSYSQVTYRFNIIIRNNSALFIGKNNKIGSTEIHVEEHQNVIIGDDSIIGSGVSIRTCDSYPIYDFETKQRVNFSDSILIGDHVWIDKRSYVSKGSQIGSGSIIGVNSYLPPNAVIHSNILAQGNPIQIVRENVFFTKVFNNNATLRASCGSYMKISTESPLNNRPQFLPCDFSESLSRNRRISDCKSANSSTLSEVEETMSAEIVALTIFFIYL